MLLGGVDRSSMPPLLKSGATKTNLSVGKPDDFLLGTRPYSGALEETDFCRFLLCVIMFLRFNKFKL